MEMHQIRYFLAVAETLNFTRAAELVHVSQPALSRAIQNLEHEIGGQLLRRERAATHLTELGRLMKPYLEQILVRADEAKAKAKGYLALDKAPLRLGLMCTLGPLRFAGLLGAFRLRHPGIELQASEGTPARLVDALGAGALDAAVLASPDGFPDRVATRPLYRERFGVAMPPTHRLANQAGVTLAELDGEPYVDRLNCEYEAPITRAMKRLGVETPVVYASEREDWVQMMVVSGAGISCLPEFSVAMPGLVVRPLVDPAIERAVMLASVAGRRHSPALAAFIRAVLAHPWR
jgi:DNA-binding transcriptional LysR family regulator